MVVLSVGRSLWKRFALRFFVCLLVYFCCHLDATYLGSFSSNWMCHTTGTVRTCYVVRIVLIPPGTWYLPAYRRTRRPPRKENPPPPPRVNIIYPWPPPPDHHHHHHVQVTKNMYSTRTAVCTGTLHLPVQAGVNNKMVRTYRRQPVTSYQWRVTAELLWSNGSTMTMTVMNEKRVRNYYYFIKYNL